MKGNYYYGMDCTGFVTWAYVNAGYNIKKGQYPPYGNTVKFTKENGEVGDVITSPGHVQLIVGGFYQDQPKVYHTCLQLQ